MKYRAEIDGLRAIAVLSVILFHANFTLFSGGFVGVDVFFVISGYLITGIISKERAVKQFTFGHFYERRIRRIFPALFFMILCCIPVFWILMTPVDLKKFAQSIFATTIFGSNFLFWRESGGYFDTGAIWKPLHHTWSLAVEEQFYIFHPIFLLIIARFSRPYKGLIMLLAIIASLIASLYIIKIDSNANFYFLPSRLWELLIGAFIANMDIEAISSKIKPIISDLAAFFGIVMIMYAVFAFSSHTSHPSLWTAIPVGGTALVIAFGRAKGVVGFVLANKIFVEVGLISYSLYLWHYPVFVFARFYFLRDLEPAHYLLLIGTSIIMAYISYKFVESPFRKKNVFTRARLFTFFAAVSLIFIAIGFIGHKSNGFPDRNSGKYQDIFQAQIIGLKDSCHCHGRDLANPCTIGDKSKTPSWALIGDSHAGALASSLEESLIQRNESGLQLTQGGCPYVLGLAKTAPVPNFCDEFNLEIRRYLMLPNIHNIVISGRYVRFLYQDGFDNKEGGKENSSDDSYFYPAKFSGEKERQAGVLLAYQKSIEELLQAGKKVYLVYPVPEVGWNVPRQAFKMRKRGMKENLTTAYDTYMERSGPVINAFNQIGNAANLIRIYPAELFCNQLQPGRCQTEMNGKTLYFDDDHVSVFGARILMDDLFLKYDRLPTSPTAETAFIK